MYQVAPLPLPTFPALPLDMSHSEAVARWHEARQPMPFAHTHWYFQALTGTLHLPGESAPHGIEAMSEVGQQVMLTLVAHAREGWLVHFPRATGELQARVGRGSNMTHLALRELCGEGDGPKLLHAIGKKGEPRVFVVLAPPLTAYAAPPVRRSASQIEAAIKRWAAAAA